MKQKSKFIDKYILQDLSRNAKKVRADIIAVTRELPSNPEHFPTDKFKLNNDGSFRAFEKHRLRVVYRVLERKISVL